MEKQEWARLGGAFAAALLVNLGLDLTTDTQDVDQPTFEELEARQEADAIRNCERVDDLQDDIRETLLDFVPPARQDEATARFVEIVCDTP